VKTPGLVRLMSDLTVLKGISRVGSHGGRGFAGSAADTERRDLGGQFQLLRRGDFSQNPLLQPNDTILIPNASAKKVFVLGEVNTPQVVPLSPTPRWWRRFRWRVGLPRCTTLERARGEWRTWNQSDHGQRRGHRKKREVVRNIHLRPGDIVYVPRTLIADVDRFSSTSKPFSPHCAGRNRDRAVPDVQSVLTKGTTSAAAGFRRTVNRRRRVPVGSDRDAWITRGSGLNDEVGTALSQ
jgi:hypothetical protein